MSSHESSKSRRPRHHLANFAYSDLTAADMRLLAPIFRHAPPLQTSAQAAYETDVRNRISALPAHLRCVYPKMNSTLCSMHKKLNALIIDSILHYLRDVVSLESLRRRNYGDKEIRTLTDMVIHWGKPSKYFATKFDVSYGRISADFIDDGKDEKKCAACTLASIADDEETLATLGGLVISSISRKLWKVSKRIMWMEEWYRAVVDSDDKPLSEVVKSLWETAIEMYRLQRHAEQERARTHVDQYMETAAETDHQWSYATPRSATYTDSTAHSHHDALPSPSPFSDEHGTTTPPPRFLQTPQAPRHASSVYSPMDNWEHYRQSEISPSVSYESRRLPRIPQQASRAPIPSSVYSCGDEEDDDEWNYPGTVASQIIESYGRREQ